MLSRVARAFVVRRRVGTRTLATRLLINQRIARGICRSRIEYRLLAAVEHLIWSMLTWPYFSDDLRVLAPYVDVCSRASRFFPHTLFVAFATFRAHVILSFAQMCSAPVGQLSFIGQGVTARMRTLDPIKSLNQCLLLIRRASAMIEVNEPRRAEPSGTRRVQR